MRQLRSLWVGWLPGVLAALGLLGFAVMLFVVLLRSAGTLSLSSLDPQTLHVVKFTLYQALLSTILSVGLGLLLAWALAHQPRFRGRSLLIALFSSSLVLPTLVVVFGLIGIYGRNGWINQLLSWMNGDDLGSYLYGLFGILLAHVYLNASFASRAFLHAFESIPQEKHKLAKSLGFGVWQRFWIVEWPSLKQTVWSSAATIFLLCFTSFAIVLILGGSPKYNTIEVSIYEAVKLDFDLPMALKLALIQLALTSVLVLLSSSFRSPITNLKKSTAHIIWQESRGIIWLQRGLILLFTLFFVTPLLSIVAEGVDAGLWQIVQRPIFRQALMTSLAVAILSALLTLLLVLVLSAAKRNFDMPTRLGRSPWARLWSLLITLSGNLYLAIPTLVMGLGFFLLALHSALPRTLWAWIAILTANVLMSLPFAMAVIYPQMMKISQRYDKLSFSLGLGRRERFFAVELPYLRGVMAYVFALAFCLSLGDLGIIALFGNESFMTLPWYLYGLMGAYQSRDAAGVALVMLLLSVAVFVWVPKLFGGRDVTHR